MGKGPPSALKPSSRARKPPTSLSGGPGSVEEGLRAGLPASTRGSEGLPGLGGAEGDAFGGRGPPGYGGRAAAPAQAGSSSLRQQHEECSLQEAAEAAERGHEPVRAEAGVGADHALEHIRLGGKRGQLESGAERVRPVPRPVSAKSPEGMLEAVWEGLWSSWMEGSSRGPNPTGGFRRCEGREGSLLGPQPWDQLPARPPADIPASFRRCRGAWGAREGQIP